MTPAVIDHASFSEIAQHHGGSLVRFAKRLVGSVDIAEEIVQEALLRAYIDRRRRSRSGGELTATVYKITRNLSVDHLRRRRMRCMDRDAMAARPDCRALSPAEEFETCMLREAVRQSVAELPEAYREVVSLRFGMGLTHRAISRQLKISVSAVEARLHRAKARLRQALSRWA